MNARLRVYKYCHSNESAIYAKGLLIEKCRLLPFGQLRFVFKEN